MEWRRHVDEEFARLGKSVDDTVVEELAQHAAAGYEDARADGASSDHAEADVRALIASWCAKTKGPQRIGRSPLPESAPAGPRSPGGSGGAGRSWFPGVDIRLALRLFRQQPGFAVVAIVMIALAVGATTTLFTVVNGVLLKPLAWAGADRLIRVTETRKATSLEDAGTMSSAAYLAWLPSPRTIEGVGGWDNPMSVTFEADGRIGAAMRAFATPSVFSLLGATPALGVGFTEETPWNTAILSHAFWLERFGGASDVIGKTVKVEDVLTVIGVMPPGFASPDQRTQVWVPLLASEMRKEMSFLNIIARLKGTATPADAAAEAQARVRALPRLAAHAADMWGEHADARMSAITMMDAVTQDVKPALLVMLAAVSLLFAAAAGNVANMQLARAMRRQKEIAIRSAIGAGHGRLTRQLLVETSILAGIGGALGIAMTFAVLRVLPRLLPSDFPHAESIAVDATALAVALGLTALVALATGLMPTRIARVLNVNRLLTDGGSTSAGLSLRAPLARSRVVIITSQVAIAAMLLVGAALLTKSFVALMRVDRGFTPESVITARVFIAGTSAPAAQRATILGTLIDRLAALPNVAAVGAAEGLPTDKPKGEFTAGTFRRPGYTGPVEKMVTARERVASPGYFEAVGMRIEGRGFDHTDTLQSEPVAIVNRAYATEYLKGGGLDQRVPAGPSPDRAHKGGSRVIGIVDDVRQTATETVKPEVYFCSCQRGWGPAAAQFMAIRTAGGGVPWDAVILRIVREVGPDAVVDQVRTLDTLVRHDISRPRLYATLLGGFGVFALLVSVIGLYSGLSYGVTQRTREIGVRSALGATPGEIVSMILKQGAVMTVAGLAVGLGGAAASVRYLSAFLFGVTPFDLTTFTLVGVAPARRGDWRVRDSGAPGGTDRRDRGPQALTRRESPSINGTQSRPHRRITSLAFK